MIGARLADVGIRKKLFFLLLGLVVVPFVIYTTMVVSQVSAPIEAMGFHTADLVLAQTASYLESRVDLVKRALDLVSLNATVRDLAVVDPRRYDEDPGLWIRDAGLLHAVEDNVGQNNPDIRAFVLYMAGGLGASLSRDESPEFRALADQAGQPWFLALDPAENLPKWFPPGTDFDHARDEDVHAVRRIAADQDLNETVGYIRADIKTRGFEGILDQAEFSPGTATFLVDASGVLVARSLRARVVGDETLVLLAKPAEGAWPRVSLGSSDYRVGRVPVGPTGWTLVTAIPNHDIGAFGDQVRVILLVLLAVMLPFMVPLSLWAASSSTRRLDSLLHGVRRLGEGGFDVELTENSRDEIGELTRSFNGMVRQIRGLLVEQYRLGVEVKTLELQALQAQINPHFLYNSLDLINGLALVSGQGRIVDAVTALSRFYRISLSGGADAIPLAKELEHVANYVTIQNLRFDDAVVLELSVEPRWQSVPVLKMILQPLVENAILHGIREKSSEKGTIAVRGETRVIDGEEGLELSVHDDGVGMAPEVLAGLLAGARRPQGTDDHGYGVFNIDRRLCLRYGAASGLRFESTPGAGTVVRFWIKPT